MSDVPPTNAKRKRYMCDESDSEGAAANGLDDAASSAPLEQLMEEEGEKSSDESGEV